MSEDILILEGIVTSMNDGQTANVAPMGPRVDRSLSMLQLRPFQTSRTYQNLKRHRFGVFHVTDDVGLLSRCVMPEDAAHPPLVAVEQFPCLRLADCCRWFAFQVSRIDDDEPRTVIDCEIVEQGTQRDFFGLNRAKHAVVEAAILASRIHILPSETILTQMDDLQTLVDKTGGLQERSAFEHLKRRICDRLES